MTRTKYGADEKSKPEVLPVVEEEKDDDESKTAEPEESDE
jgi:hypothetical protein